MTSTDRPDFSFLQKVMIVAGAVALFLFVREMGQVMCLLFAGVLLGVALHGLGEVVAKRLGWSVDASLTLCLVVLALLVAASLWFFGREVAKEFDDFLDASKAAVEQIAEELGKHELGRQAMSWSADKEWVSGGGLMAKLTGVVSAAAQAVAAVGIILSMALFLAYRPEAYRDGVLALVPPARRQRIADVLDTTACILRRWVAGRVIDMVVMGAATSLGLWLMGVRAPLALGLFTGLILFIPFFGPILATLPAALVALPDGPGLALGVVALFVCLQIAEGFLLLPLIEETAVELPAAVVIGNQILLAALLGLPGILVATPLLAAGAVAVKMLYIQDVLGDDASVGECDTSQRRIKL